MDTELRLKKLQATFSEIGCAGAILFYSRDILYYTGTAQPSYLVVSPDDYTLFVKSGYRFALRDTFIDPSRIKEERSLKKIFQEVKSRFKTNRIGMELDVLPTTQYIEYKDVLSGIDLFNISPVIQEQKTTKDRGEIEKIKQACRVVHAGHEAVLSFLKEGVSELELSAEIEKAHRLAGHDGEVFVRRPDFIMSRGPISSGSNLLEFSGVVYSVTGVGLSPSVPIGPSRKEIRIGDLVMVDIPVSANGYHADQSRTYLLGKADDKTKELYNALKKIADHLCQEIRPGMTCSHIYNMALKKSVELKVEDAFLNFGNNHKSRLIGHGVGLEVNESPSLSSYDTSEIQENMVLAIELHMMDKNIGVLKLEDMLLVGKKLNEILTISPRNLIEIH